MAQISGIPVENITNIAGVAATSIISLVGIPTTSLPGWPSSGPTCKDLIFSYGEAPGVACGADAEFYSFNENNSRLYLYGYCNDENYYAPSGFYVDTFGNIYNWQETTMGWSWSFFGTCTPTPTCDDMSFSFGEAPGIACSAGASFYSFDSTNNLLYNFGSCGGDYAPEGFYSDGTVVYWWHTVGRVLVWEVIGECG